MRNARLRRRRTRAHPGIRATVAFAVLLTSGIAAGLTGYLASATDAGARTTLSDESQIALAYELSSTGGDPAQIDAALTDRLAGLDVAYQLHRSEISGARVMYIGADGPLPATDEDVAVDDEDGLGHLVLVAYQDFTDHAELIAGDWPDSPSGSAGIPLAIHEAPAAELGLVVGDQISFGDQDDVVVLEVVGLWRPMQPASPFWLGEREADGSDGNTDLVGVLAQDALADVPGLTLTNRWRLLPDIDRLRASDVATLQSSLPRVLPGLERDDRTAGARLQADAGLLTALRNSQEKLRAAQSVTVAPLLLFVLAGVLALVLVGLLLAQARGSETAVYRARGTSLTQVLRWSLAEACATVLPASAAGALAAWLVLRLLIGPDVAVVALAAGAALAASIAIGTVAAVGTVAVRASARAATEHRGAAARHGFAVQAALAVLTAVVAVVTMWQLLRYGGPAVEDARGRARIDPLAVAAPVAALAAAGLLATAGVAFGARCVQALAARRRTLGSVLAIRSVARRPGGHVLPIVLIVLAAGMGTLAAGLSGTWADLQRAAAVQRTGADVQVVLSSRPVNAAAATADTASLGEFRDLPGATSVTPVLSGWVQLSGSQVQLAAAAGDPPRRSGAKLPADAESVELVFTATMTAHELDYGDAIPLDERPDTPPAGRVRVLLWLADADGLVSAVPADDLEIADSVSPSRYVARATLPAGTAPWTVVGLELTFDGHGMAAGVPMWATDFQIRLAEIGSMSGDALSRVRRPAEWSFGFAGGEPRRTGHEYTATQDGTGPEVVVTSDGVPFPAFGVRLLAGEWPDRGGDPAPVPVLATATALDQAGLTVGDRPTIRINGSEVPVEISGVTDDVGGMLTEHVLVADLGAITDAALASASSVPLPNQVWIEAPDAALSGGALADAARSIAGPRAEVIDRIGLEESLRANAFARMSLVTHWVVTGSVVLLTGLGLVTASRLVARQRRTEVGVLRALGASPKVQARLGRREQLVVAALAILLGTVAGAGVTALVAGLLASAATPAQLYGVTPELRIQLLPWGIALGALTVVAVVVAVLHGERLRRAGTESPPRGWAA